MNNINIEMFGRLTRAAWQTARPVMIVAKLLGRITCVMLFFAPAYTYAKVCEAEFERALAAETAWHAAADDRKNLDRYVATLSTLECVVEAPASLENARRSLDKNSKRLQENGPGTSGYSLYYKFVTSDQLRLCVLLERETQCKSQKSSLTESDAQKIHTQLVESDRKAKADLEKYCENPLRFRCEWAVRNTQRLAIEVNTYNSNPELVKLTGKLEVESPVIAAPYARRQQTATSAEKLAAMASSGSSSSGNSHSSAGTSGSRKSVGLPGARPARIRPGHNMANDATDCLDLSKISTGYKYINNCLYDIHFAFVTDSDLSSSGGPTGGKGGGSYTWQPLYHNNEPHTYIACRLGKISGSYVKGILSCE